LLVLITGISGHNYGKSPFSSWVNPLVYMAMFNSYVTNYQRVKGQNCRGVPLTFPGHISPRPLDGYGEYKTLDQVIGNFRPFFSGDDICIKLIIIIYGKP